MNKKTFQKEKEKNPIRKRKIFQFPEEQEDKNKHIKPRQQAPGQKALRHFQKKGQKSRYSWLKSMDWNTNEV